MDQDTITQETDLVEDEVIEQTLTEELEDYEEEVTEEIPEVKNPREAAMDAIVAKRNEEHEELEDESDPSDETVNIKVDGEEQEISKEKIDEYQMDQAAQERLRQAAEIKKQAEEERATLKTEREEFDARLQALEESRGSMDDTESTLEIDEEDFDREEFIREIREGDDEDAIRVTEKLLSAVQKAVKVPDVKSAVQNELREQEAASQREQEELNKQAQADAETKFQDAFKSDIEKSEDFYNLAIMEDGKLQADEAWQTKSLDERYAEAGARAQRWIKGQSATSRRATKVAKKARTVSLKQTSARADIGKDEVQDTPSDIIRQIAEARGQTHL